MALRARAAAPASRAVAIRRPLVCLAAQKEAEQVPLAQRVALPLASMVAAAMMAGAAFPEEALAAQSRSGGRVGGSSGFAARKAPAQQQRGVQAKAA